MGGLSGGGLEEELTEVSVGVVWILVHVGGGGQRRKSKQLEHMADCQQPGDLGLFLLTPSPPDLFIYLPFYQFAKDRKPAGLE
ncbi:hypothetical protein PAMP_011687 [Pampus punctatissimus]